MSKRHHTKSVSKDELRIRQDVKMIIESINRYPAFLDTEEDLVFWVYHFKPNQEVKRRVLNALEQIK